MAFGRVIKVALLHQPRLAQQFLHAFVTVVVEGDGALLLVEVVMLRREMRDQCIDLRVEFGNGRRAGRK